MLTEICQYLHNWFNRKPDGTMYPSWSGEFTVTAEGVEGVELADGQYFRILGSLFNDGVHKVGDTLIPETFTGDVWSMGIPPQVVALAEEIAGWQSKYGGVDSENMSPFNSESFGGYSYTKAGASAASGGGTVATWRDVYATRLNAWRKL